MLSSTTGVFRDPDDFQSAMREYGCKSLVVTGHGSFRMRLTRIALHHVHLLCAEEYLARIAFFAIPTDAILLSFPLGNGNAPLWGGTRLRIGEVVTVGAGSTSHSRSASRCRWGGILLPTQILRSHARKVTGDPLILPVGVCHWQPSAKASRHLVQLHVSATRVADARAGVIVTSEPARTLEHELIDAVVACLTEKPAEVGGDAKARHADIMGRLEDLLLVHPNSALSSAEVCVALGISGRTMRACCAEHLGVGPNTYMRLRRMQLVRRALRSANSVTASVSQIAAEHGFSQAGRFAGAYRERFGELPSDTLRRGSDQ